MGLGFALNTLLFFTNFTLLSKTHRISAHNSNIPILLAFPLVLVLYSVTISVLSDHFQAWLTEIHEYTQQDVVVMLLGNKVRTFLPVWADVWTDGLRGRGEGMHYGSCIKPTFI